MVAPVLKIEVRGVQQTIDRLAKEGVRVKQGALRGLLAGSLMIQRRAQRKTPVEYGILRASAYTKRLRGGDVDTVVIGYKAPYALWVHEKTGEKLRGIPRRSGLGTYWNPGESKFLQKAYDESIDEVIELIERYAKEPLGTE